jgi:hypothetical protein
MRISLGFKTASDLQLIMTSCASWVGSWPRTAHEMSREQDSYASKFRHCNATVNLSGLSERITFLGWALASIVIWPKAKKHLKIGRRLQSPHMK